MDQGNIYTSLSFHAIETKNSLFHGMPVSLFQLIRPVPIVRTDALDENR